MRIGELATRAGVNRQTIRYYERERLLPTPQRRANGYREYPEEMVGLIRFIKRAQGLGFCLGEVRTLCELRSSTGEDRTRVRSLAQSKLLDVRNRIARLREIERVLGTLLTNCCADATSRCGIVAALDGADSARVRRRSGESRSVTPP